MKTALIRKFGLALAIGLLLATNLGAQSYSVNWFTIDGGGGSSSAGPYTIRGTIGQPDAGAASGNGYFLAGGFWHAFETGPASPPLLRIARAGTSALISWPNPSTGFQLQESPTLSGVWGNVSDVPAVVGAEKQVTVPATMSARFYRLQKP
jgi:hypothetical protein